SNFFLVKMAVFISFFAVTHTMNQFVTEVGVCFYKTVKRTDSGSGGHKQEFLRWKHCRLKPKKTKRTVHLKVVAWLHFFQAGCHLSVGHFADQNFYVFVIFTAVHRIFPLFDGSRAAQNHKLPGLKW